jgi:hypothetical protein
MASRMPLESTNLVPEHLDGIWQNCKIIETANPVRMFSAVRATYKLSRPIEKTSQACRSMHVAN